MTGRGKGKRSREDDDEGAEEDFQVNDDGKLVIKEVIFHYIFKQFLGNAVDV